MADWLTILRRTEFDGELPVSARVADSQLAKLPAKRGVALLVGRQGRPVVLLPAADMRSRVRNRLQNPDRLQRRNMPDLAEITERIFWKRAWGYFENDLNYFELARAIWPTTYTKLTAWKPAWFVHVDTEARFPNFVRTREVFGAPGRYFGPFVDGRSAERFVEVIRDAFDLCRDYSRLVRSPRGRACSYAQIGKCLSPCDGGITMDEYRRVVTRAAGFASGADKREGLKKQLRERMSQASEKLLFEEASAVKARLERLAEFETPVYRHVGPAEEFRFVLVQPGESRDRARVFLIDRGAIAPAAALEYPPRAEQVRAVLDRMVALVGARHVVGRTERWRMGLVSRYIYSSERRRGLIVRWRESLGCDELAAEIETSADLLGLRARKKRPSGSGAAGKKRPSGKGAAGKKTPGH